MCSAVVLPMSITLSSGADPDIVATSAWLATPFLVLWKEMSGSLLIKLSSSLFGLLSIVRTRMNVND